MCSSCSCLTLHRINNLLHCLLFSSWPTYINYQLILIWKPRFSTPVASCCSLTVNDLKCSIPKMPCLWCQSLAPSHHQFFPGNKRELLPLTGPAGQQLRQTNSHGKVIFVLCVGGSSIFHCQLCTAFTALCGCTTATSGAYLVQPQSHTEPKGQLCPTSASGTWGV